MALYSRNISVKIEEVGSDFFKAEAFMDSIFEVANKKESFGLEVVITKKGFEIMEISRVSIEGLSEGCQKIIPKLQGIVGLSVTAGYNKKVMEIVGGAEGCTHMAELLMEIGRCVFQAHHGQILSEQGIDECIESFNKISKVSCLGVCKHEK